MLKVLTIIGTRPEAIKLAPVVMELGKHPDKIQNRTCVTAQHREMLDHVLEWFGILPDYDLNLMHENQDLPGFASRALMSVTGVLEKVAADLATKYAD